MTCNEITAVRDKIGHRPYEYFKRMVDAYGSSDLLRIYIAEHEGEPLSGAICIHYGNKTGISMEPAPTTSAT